MQTFGFYCGDWVTPHSPVTWFNWRAARQFLSTLEETDAQMEGSRLLEWRAGRDPRTGERVEYLLVYEWGCDNPLSIQLTGQRMVAWRP